MPVYVVALLQNLALKTSSALPPSIRQGSGLDREARSLYTLILRATENNQQTFTSVSAVPTELAGQ